MATPQSKTRTNYFKVNDKEAFKGLLDKLVTDESTPVTLMQNDKGEVGFCCDAAVYGIKPDILSEKVIEAFKKALFTYGMEEIEEFVGMDVSGWDKDSIDSAMSETIDQMPEEDWKKYVDQYVDNNSDYEEMYDEMINQIQALLEPGHACIITGIGWEKLRSLTACATVITPNESNIIDLNETALGYARAMLRNNEYNPQTTY